MGMSQATWMFGHYCHGQLFIYVISLREVVLGLHVNPTTGDKKAV